MCLYSRGANKDEKNDDGNTAREVAELNKMTEIVKILESKNLPT